MKKIILLLLISLFIGRVSAQNTTKDYFLHIRKHGTDPISYLTEKIRTHSVLAIGEDHWIKDHPIFLCKFIEATAKDTLTDIDVLALEFGNMSDQKLVDEFLKNDDYREDLVFKILQHAPDTYGNPYLEYAKIFQTVWQTNKEKAPHLKTKILLLDPEYIQNYMDGEKYTYTCSRDDNMFSLIRNCIIQNQHVLFYGGSAHTQAQIRGVEFQDRYYNFPSAGYLLKKCYPKDVFIVNLWGAHMGNLGYVHHNESIWLQIDNGSIDKAFEMNGNIPVAFNLGGAFNTLTAKQYYANPTNPENWGGDPLKGSPYTQDILMKEWIDGIVFIAPVSQFTGQTLIDIYDTDFIKKVEKRSKGKIKNIDELFSYLRSIHPILQ